MENPDCSLDIKPETFEKLTPAQQNFILYDCLNALKIQVTRMDKKLNRKLKIEQSISAASGFVGGLIASLTGFAKH
jgi:hypothetical protein